MKYLLALCLAMISGCAYQAAEKLTAEQMDSLVKLREATGSDLYLCGNVNGPPPMGGITFLIYPKETKPSIAFDSSCRLLQNFGLGLSGFTIRPVEMQLTPVPQNSVPLMTIPTPTGPNKPR